MVGYVPTHPPRDLDNLLEHLSKSIIISGFGINFDIVTKLIISFNTTFVAEYVQAKPILGIVCTSEGSQVSVSNHATFTSLLLRNSDFVLFEEIEALF